MGNEDKDIERRQDLRVTIAAWSISLLLVGGIVALVLYQRSKVAPALHKARTKLTAVEVRTVAPQRYEEALVLPARLLADKQAAVSSELAGILKEWVVDEGAQVTAGQVVARVDTRTLEAQLAEVQAQKKAAETGVAQAQQQLAAARVGLDQAKQQLPPAQLALDGARSAAELATKEFDRVKQMLGQDVATQAELDTAQDRKVQADVAVQQAEEGQRAAALGVRQAEVAVAQAGAAIATSEAGVAQLEARLESIRTDIAKAELRAPVSGQLEEHLVQAGEVISVGRELAWIYDLRYVRAQVDVADRYVPFLDQNGPAIKQYIAAMMPGAQHHVQATLILPGLPKLTGGKYAGLPFPAEVAFISQTSDPLSNTFRVELRMTNPGGALKQGILAQARLVYLVYPEALVIPLAAVQVADVGPRALVVRDEDGRQVARVRDIVPVSIQQDRLLITKGLEPGDRLIVAGGRGVVDGEEVNIIVEDGKLLREAAETPPAGG